MVIFILINILFLYFNFIALRFQKRQKVFFIKSTNLVEKFPINWLFGLVFFFLAFLIFNEKKTILYFIFLMINYQTLTKILLLRFYYYFFQFFFFRKNILNIQSFLIYFFVTIEKTGILFTFILIAFFSFLSLNLIFVFYFLYIFFRLLYSSLVIWNDHIVIGIGDGPYASVYLTMAGKQKMKIYRKSLFDFSIKNFDKERFLIFKDYFYVDDDINKLVK